MGFLMRCDQPSELVMFYLKPVSIPVGFSDALRPSSSPSEFVQTNGFQSLLGFLMRCDLTKDKQTETEDTVSIPVGFSDALRRNDCSWIISFARFQSLLGFLMRCDSIFCYLWLLSSLMFQSLLGFLMRCDLDCDGLHAMLEEFQSLLGFLMRCDLTKDKQTETEDTVSIPVGFSDALRRNDCSWIISFARFQSLLGFLMRCDSIFCYLWLLSSLMFQSLLGFLMRCDLDCDGLHAMLEEFQSLLGFLMRCDLGVYPVGFLLDVSIPVGFSDALRHSL